jgi:hypothetical protein
LGGRMLGEGDIGVAGEGASASMDGHGVPEIACEKTEVGIIVVRGWAREVRASDRTGRVRVIAAGAASCRAAGAAPGGLRCITPRGSGGGGDRAGWAVGRAVDVPQRTRRAE